MGGLIGPVGGLVEVPFTSSEEEEMGARSIYAKALSGRITEQRGPRSRRVWNCSIDISRPDDHHFLDQLASGAIGVGPHVWYSAMARVTNILTPAQSLMDDSAWTGGAQGGAGVAADGTRYLASRTLREGENMLVTDRLAVPQGMPVTASAYISTHPDLDARLVVREYDPEGTEITPQQVSELVQPGTWAQRVSLTFTPAPRTVAIEFRVHRPLMVTMPAVSFTHRPMAWSSGRGCATASLNLTGSDPRFAFESEDGWGRRESRSFTITELG